MDLEDLRTFVDVGDAGSKPNSAFSFSRGQRAVPR